MSGSQHRRTSSESGLFQTRALEKQLRSAAWDGRLKDVQRLLALGTDVNSGDEYGRCALHLAAYHGIEPVVSALISAGAVLDSQDKAHDTPLHYASHEGRVNVARLLVNAGATVSVVDKDGKSPTDWAKARNHTAIVNLLTESLNNKTAASGKAGNGAVRPATAWKASSGADALGGDGESEYTELHDAAKHGRMEDLERLMSGGERVLECQDSVGWTALLFAAWQGHEDAVKALLQAGANKNHVTKGGNTALHIAAGKGHDRIVKVLISHQCRCDIKNSDRETAMDCARKQEHYKLVAFIEEAMRVEAELNRRTPNYLLREAAKKNDRAEIERQLKAGADINSRDDIGRTALMCAAFCGSEVAAATLLEMGASKNTTDNYGATALIWCAHGGADRVATLLIKAGATCNAPDEVRNTALHWAAYYGHENMVRALLCSLARTDIVNRKGLTPYEEARMKIPPPSSSSSSRRDAKSGHLTVAHLLDSNKGVTSAQLLSSGKCTSPDDCLRETARQGRHSEIEQWIQKGADVNSQDSNGRTPLIYAADYGNDVAVQVLLKHGANPSLADADGYTPLHWAAFFGNEYSIRILLSAGADATKKDKHSKIPADWARSLRHYSSAKLLEEAATKSRAITRKPTTIPRREISNTGEGSFGKVDGSGGSGALSARAVLSSKS